MAALASGSEQSGSDVYLSCVILGMDYDNPNKIEKLSWTLYPESQPSLYPCQVKQSRSAHVQGSGPKRHRSCFRICSFGIIADFTGILLTCKWWDLFRWVLFYVVRYKSSFTRDIRRNFLSAAMAAVEFEPYPTVYDGWSTRTRIRFCDWYLVTSKSYVRWGKCNIEARVPELMKSQRFLRQISL